MTFGNGDYSRAMLERGARVIAIDRDPSVSDLAEQLKDDYKDNFDFKVSKITNVRQVIYMAGDMQ